MKTSIIIYGYHVAIYQYGNYVTSRTYNRLGNAQKFANRFRGVGSEVRIWDDGILIAEKFDTQKF